MAMDALDIDAFDFLIVGMTQSKYDKENEFQFLLPMRERRPIVNKHSDYQIVAYPTKIADEVAEIYDKACDYNEEYATFFGLDDLDLTVSDTDAIQIARGCEAYSEIVAEFLKNLPSMLENYRLEELKDYIGLAPSASQACYFLNLHERMFGSELDPKYHIDLEQMRWAVHGVDADNELVKAVHVDGNAILFLSDAPEKWSAMSARDVWLHGLDANERTELSPEQQQQWDTWTNSLADQQRQYAERFGERP
jgi:hypothetical protein